MFGSTRVGGGPEFSGEPVFAMGSVFGARHFKVRADGALTGVVYTREWTAGTNIADCRVRVGYRIPGKGVSTHVVRKFIDDPEWEPPEGWDSRYPPRIHVGWEWNIDGEEGYVDGIEQPEIVYQDWYGDDHDFAGCTCGFYAYLQGSMNYADGLNVAGVVEAFGLVRQGSRGFRAQKARIRALYVPPVRESSRVWDGLSYDKELPMSEALRRADGRSRVTATTRVKIASRYPTVPMFTDLDEMLRAFPTDPPKEGS